MKKSWTPRSSRFEAVVGQDAQSADFGREGEAAVLTGQTERLDAKRVAGECQPPLAAVPDRRGIHAVELEPGLVAPVQLGGEQGLGVAVRLEGDARRLELAAKVEVIVNLAVEDDAVAAIGRKDRLVPAGEVDDAEPPHAEAEIAVGEIAGVIGTAMDDAVALLLDDRLFDRTAARPVPTGDAANETSILSLG